MYIGFFDGACEPRNPNGNMGIGAVIYEVNDATLLKRFRNGETSKEVFGNLSPVFFHSECIMYGERGFTQTSNNVAEYMGVIEIMKKLHELKAESAYIFGDSKLVVEQLNGYWKIKQGAYVKYAHEAKKLLKPDFKFIWIRREYNDIGDDLSKVKMIERGVEFKIQPNK